MRNYITNSNPIERQQFLFVSFCEWNTSVRMEFASGDVEYVDTTISSRRVMLLKSTCIPQYQSPPYRLLLIKFSQRY